MEYSIFDQLQKSGWNLFNHQQKNRRDFNLNNLELQSISRQISILRFFSLNIKHIPSGYSPITFEKAMKQKPVKFLDKFSTHQYIYLHDYLIKMISYPRTLSKLIGIYFTKDGIRLNFFARVTFPSIFHNFVTEELHKAGALLVNNIILNQQMYIVKAFFLSFIEFTPNFFISIWFDYEQKVKELKEKDKNDKIEHPGSLSAIFLSSLSKSLLLLSKSQIKLFQTLLNRSENDFGSIVLHTMFPNSYFDYFHDKVKEPKQSAIVQMLQTASFYPNSPFFKKISKTITSPKYLKTRPSHKESGLMNQTPIVLSLHELFLLQQIFFNGSKSKKENSENNNHPDENIDSLNNQKINSFREKTGIFVFSAELCKNNFDPIYMDLNLTQFLTKNEEPAEIPLFTIGINENQNNNNSENVKKFINDFNAYLASLTIEKFYKSSIHEKKLELFITIGIYSQKCIDHSLTNHKSSLYCHNTFSVIQSTNSFMIPTDSFNLIKVSLPTSISISSINQTDYTTLNDQDKNNDNDIDEKEIKVQKVIDQLDLNKNVKDEVNNLLEKFGKPNDEISMFILVRQLDIIKHQSKSKSESKDKNEGNEEEDSKNNTSYLELHYHESLEKFKKKIIELNENSENSLNKIDKNCYFHKFIRMCATKIDELADRSHFHMIFGLVFIGLELNEIAHQLSKNKKNKRKQILEKMIPFINSIFIHSNNKMFDVFVWYHRFVNTFPEIRKVIPKKPRAYIEFLVDYFYRLFDFAKEEE